MSQQNIQGSELSKLLSPGDIIRTQKKRVVMITQIKDIKNFSGYVIKKPIGDTIDMFMIKEFLFSEIENYYVESDVNLNLKIQDLQEEVKTRESETAYLNRELKKEINSILDKVIAIKEDKFNFIKIKIIFLFKKHDYLTSFEIAEYLHKTVPHIRTVMDCLVKNNYGINVKKIKSENSNPPINIYFVGELNNYRLKEIYEKYNPEYIKQKPEMFEND